MQDVTCKHSRRKINVDILASTWNSCWRLWMRSYQTQGALIQSWYHLQLQSQWRSFKNPRTAAGYIPYNGNHQQEKSFTNFVNLEAFANVFLHFLSRQEFLYMRLPELRKFSCELRPRRQFAKLFFRGWFPLYGMWHSTLSYKYRTYRRYWSRT